MNSQTYTIVIPTHERLELLGRALESAFGQTLPPSQVIVVDDGSEVPVRLAPDQRVRLVRLEQNRGNAAARNAGLAAARCRWITFLDDDDVLLPIMAERSLAALQATGLPAPVGVISGVEVIGIDGRTLDIRLPPTLARGRHFALEDIPAGASFLSKQTLFVEREVLLAIGGFDEAFRSRAPSEMFLRLNPVCSLLGLREVTYRQFRHQGARVSTDRRLRRASFAQLVAKHEAVFRAHPRGFARMLVEHARTLSRDGDRAGALRALVRAARLAPAAALHLLAAGRKRRKA